LPGPPKDQAYFDQEHIYGDEANPRILLRPRDFAKLIASVDPQPTDIVLDIGAGSGYSTAILGYLTEMVVAIEPDTSMRKLAAKNLEDLAIDNHAGVEGDLKGGAVDQGPYDLIFIGAGIAVRPDSLLNQLKDGGRLAVIWTKEKASKGALYTRSGDDFSQIFTFDAASRFTLPDFHRERSFQF